MSNLQKQERPNIEGGHPARYIDERVPHHIISRVFQGRHLLRPCEELTAIIVGVLARARELYPAVSLFTLAFLSNHLHMILKGSSQDVPRFIGFIKREISRRWGAHRDVNWQGTMWHEYLATALPTPESEVNAMKYVLSQGVKENLVERPQEWPGVHAAASLMSGNPLVGKWLDATSYAKAKDAANRTAKPKKIHRADYERECTVSFDPLPAWSALPSRQQRRSVKELIEAIIEEGAEHRRRADKTVFGAANVMLVPLDYVTKLPPQPWYQDRRRMVCWADPRDERTQAYLADYWAFQSAFTQASRAFRTGDVSAQFPIGAFRPVTHLASSPIGRGCETATPGTGRISDPRQ